MNGKRGEQKNMDKETFLSICNGYEGKIEEQDDSIIFSAYNKLETWENVEEIKLF